MLKNKAQIKEENEIQSYINSFKEIEEQDDNEQNQVDEKTFADDPEAGPSEMTIVGEDGTEEYK